MPSQPRNGDLKIIEVDQSEPQIKQSEVPTQKTQTNSDQTVRSSEGESQSAPMTNLIEQKAEQIQLKEGGGGDEIVKALRQVVSMPKIKYMHFEGDAINYASFMHNFETCLEKDNPDNSTRLQLLIQHCTGKARDAIESCVNLPAQEGYNIAKNTLYENFGKPHIIAKAHVLKLMNLPLLKQADGPSLLELTRHLEVANRTLASMGPEYESELDHMNTLRELNRKLPLFMRVRWTECAGSIIESGSRPKFKDFLLFVKKRAKLVNNEFGEDLCSGVVRKDGGKRLEGKKGPSARTSSFAAGAYKRENGRDGNFKERRTSNMKCLICQEGHRIWKCDKFKKLPYHEKMKFVQEHEFCFRCLTRGHYARSCPKTDLKCRVEGCGKGHNTLLHPPQTNTSSKEDSKDKLCEGNNTNKKREPYKEGSPDEVKVAVATGAGDRVCLSVVPLKVKAKGENRPSVRTYALMDSGSEVTLGHKSLQNQLGITGRKLDFTLTGMTGSTELKSELVDIVLWTTAQWLNYQTSER
ncbi:uncharacterized protein LOC124456428 [Xenia sp. Carnegie-2017]|uniref:uncharacterized protein LOC124456428 n=1 Tax=Xenia sp. Carnegie-2017 TaxID=2897299 RepID=UPI001F033E7E|nr:uncharacterized protein LOC124456428 [Xenia sp. Carnegie-2017]